MPSEFNFVSLPEEEFVKESVAIVEKAESMGIVLRIIGALATYIHSSNCSNAMKVYERIERFGKEKFKFTDLDLMAYSKQRKQVTRLFEKTLRFDREIMISLFSSNRRIYHHPKGYYQVDVFFDKLEFSHDVKFGSKPGKGRLELDYPTITLVDIVLGKTQIHHINLKDIVDLIVLFVSHDIGTVQNKETIDGKYMASVLSDDWGFWYDAIHNLEAVKQFSEKFYLKSNLTKKEHSLITDRIDKLLKIIDDTPKTKNWLKSASVGTSKPWYREVEEVIR